MKIEMHAHTKEVSPCACIPAKVMVKAYADAGYQGLVITDHFNGYVLESFPGSPRERVTKYIEGFQRAEEAAEGTGLRIILGMESCIAGGGDDFLIYGIDVNFLYEHPQFYAYTQEEAFRACEEYGALLFQAHPGRPGRVFRDVRYMHGVEWYNGNPRDDNNNEKVWEWAKQYPQLLHSSGSDYHNLEDLACAGIILPYEVHNSRELAEAMRKRDHQLITQRQV